MPHITTFDRITWGRAALDALRAQQDAKAIIAAYCQAKEGNPDPYDDLQDVASDALTDTLHAINAEQMEAESYERVIQPDELNLGTFERMVNIVSTHINNPEFGEADFTRRAYSHFLEEQEESLQE